MFSLLLKDRISDFYLKICTGMYDENLRSMACIACHCRNGMTSQQCCRSNWMCYALMAWLLHRRGMCGVNLKVLVAMVTELCTHSISALACNACHAPEICILHTSANFEKSKTIFLKQIFFLKSLNSVFMMKQRWGLDRNNVLRPTPEDH